MPELPQITLLDYLQHPLDPPEMMGLEEGQISKSCYKHEKWPKIRELHRWTDFHPRAVLDLVQTQCPGILSKKAPYKLPDIAAPVREVYEEENLQSYFEQSQQVVIRNALQHSSKDVVILDGRELCLVQGSQTVFRHGKLRQRPDWAGTCSGVLSSEKTPFNILPGDTKTSWVFRSDEIKDDLLGPEEEEDKDAGGGNYGRKYRALAEHKSVWPMRQVAYYCIYAHVRYGFIISDREVVAIKVESLYNSSSSLPWVDHLHQHLLVRFAAIPNDFSEPRDAHLSLYFLHILAARSGYLVEGDCAHQTLQEYWERGTPVWAATNDHAQSTVAETSSQRAPGPTTDEEDRADSDDELRNDRKHRANVEQDRDEDSDGSTAIPLGGSHTGLSFTMEDFHLIKESIVPSRRSKESDTKTRVKKRKASNRPNRRKRR